MDAVARDDRGQAVVVAALFIAIAALAIVGLRAAQERLLDAERVRRAGEAAVEAAVAVFADAYAANIGTEALAAMSDSSIRERARAAADALSRANGGVAVDEIPAVTCGPLGAEVSVTIAGHLYRAGFDASCSRH